MKTWQAHQQPDLTICPEQCCWFWNEVGTKVNEGKNNWVTITERGCGYRVGLCFRDERVQSLGSVKEGLSVKDFYEPCETELKKADLPDFYFNKPAWQKTEESQKAYKQYFRLEEEP